MSEEKSFGILIKRAMDQKGWTQEELAAEVGVSRGTVNRWAQDVQRPADHYLKKLIDALELDETEAYTLYYAGGKMPSERHNLPLPNRFFTGREGYLEQLRELLEKDHVVALSGLGGIGKTQIALKYALMHHPDMYPTALWVNADTLALEASFSALAETLKLPESHAQEVELRIKAVMKWLEEHTNWLLVMDNADELPLVERFLLSRPRGHIILTTRWQFPEKFGEPLDIEPMEPEEGLRFLYKRSRVGKNEATEADGRRIVKELGGHALALEQAGAYIRETNSSFADFMALYDENYPTLLSQHGALDGEHREHPLPVMATIMMSIAKAKELSPLAEDILHFCMFLITFSIPLEPFHHDESFNDDILALNKGFAALLRYSLIKRNRQGNTFSMHKLVQRVVLDTMFPDLVKSWGKRVLRAILAAYPVTGFDKWNELEFSQILMCTHMLAPDEELSSLYGSFFAHTGWYLHEPGQPHLHIQLFRAVIVVENEMGSSTPLSARSSAFWVFNIMRQKILSRQNFSYYIQSTFIRSTWVDITLRLSLI